MGGNLPQGNSAGEERSRKEKGQRPAARPVSIREVKDRKKEEGILLEVPRWKKHGGRAGSLISWKGEIQRPSHSKR